MALGLTVSRHQRALVKEGDGGLHGLGAVADVGGAALDGGQGLLVQGGRADDQVGLGGVVGDGEAQGAHGLPVVVVLVGTADKVVLTKPLSLSAGLPEM